MNSRIAGEPAIEPTTQGQDAVAGSGAVDGIYAGIAGLGIAALAAASSSSLASGLSFGASAAPWWVWLGAIASAAWALLALVYAVASLRKGTAPATKLAVRCLAVVSIAHLASIALGLAGIPGREQFLDLTVGSLLLLELSVLAAIMWQRKRQLKSTRGPARSSSLAVVGSIFAASVVVSAIASTGLAASSAGHLAVPHSEHGAHHTQDIDPGIIDKMKQEEHHH
ncbi:hypothetical protein OF385_14595 [Glutamicibacter sp. JL.03c]|uniref:hypothetical protein n=1 Tax=Glutamicibacter sp. JL.03c TaxID=2984842 RepID=UPI0021F79736|nr:hypothetical protein [Glutamicibacter sp. JL.03c]UYQ77231.1 hypothetical protein OF385_14595 [Glutamicibacter sp. JL.03c]